jgi:hypothetical protein
VVHVMVVMVVMMDVVMMMVMMHRLGHGSSGGRRFLRHGISGKAEREDGRGRKGLDHGRTFPVV